MTVTAAPLRQSRVFVGTCAWSFDDWRNVFYPHDLPRNRWLEFYARHFHAVEMDSSFHHMPSAQTAEHWSDLVGDNFRFCPKLPKTLSHEKRLENFEPEVGMMQRLAEELGPHFGCALLQLPPSFHAGRREEVALRAFLRGWPTSLPLAVEFRHASWETPHAAALCGNFGATWVWADTLPPGEDKHAGFGFLPVTSPCIYVRLLGDYRHESDDCEARRHDALLWPRDMALEHWAAKLRCHGDVDVIYVFVGNQYEGMAVETARRLAALIGVQPPGENKVLRTPGEQPDLFDSSETAASHAPPSD